MENNKQKTAIIALVALAIVGVIGGTIAYFTSETTFRNEFHTKPYITEFTEEFEAPKEWLPGTVTSKKVYVTNTGDIDLAVRISYTEEWTSADGTVLPLIQEQEDKQVRAAIINFPNETDWLVEESGTPATRYYYYKNGLKKDGRTSLFIDKVTFNSDIDIEYTCTNIYTYTDDSTSEGSAPEEGKTVKTTTQRCQSTNKTYAGATYVLTIKIETVQYDKYKEFWGTSVEIGAPAL